MAIGVYVSGVDEALVDAVAFAIDRDEGLWLAPSPDQARVVLAEPAALSRVRDRVPEAGALVVLAAADQIGAARAALRVGADGIVSWPQDASTLGTRVAEAAARKVARGKGVVIAVRGVRGGAGATTIAAHLAAAFGADSLLLDARGGPAGQALYAEAPVAATMATAGGADATPEGVRRAAAAHASGARCVYGAPAPVAVRRELVECARLAAPVTIVDGAVPDANVTVLVLGPDVGSVRSASALLPGEGRALVVLNHVWRGRVGVRAVRRALDAPVFAVPHDAVLRRGADRGRVPRRGPGPRAIRRLARLVRNAAAEGGAGP